MIEDNLLDGNKYFNWYWSICNRAKDRILDPSIYTERHHIYPKSIYGQNKDLVKLTAKEHYIVHLLLWQGLRFKYGQNNDYSRKMASAFVLMNTIGKKENRRKIKNSNEFELLRIARSESQKNKKRSSEDIDKQKKSWSLRTIEQNEQRLKKYKETLSNRTIEEIEDTKRKQRESAPKFKSKEHKEKIGKSHLGIKRTWYSPGNTGGKHTDEFKEKQSNNVKNRRWYNNGTIDIYIKSTDIVPEGFIKGRCIYKNNKYGDKNGRNDE